MIHINSPALHHRYVPVPICKCHHNVQSGESKHEMEETPTVCHLFFFIVPDFGIISTLDIRIAPFYFSIIWLHLGKQEITEKKKATVYCK